MRRKDMKTIALCIDKENGRSFYGRRTSSDREVRKRLLDMCDTLYVDSYTAAQFTEDYGKEKLRVVDDPAGIGEGTAFIELQDIPEDADRIIIFQWPKKYPADRFLNFRFSGWRKVEKEDFPGYAHEKVTMNVWERKKEKRK